MMHSSIWEALFVGSVSGKTWPTRAYLVQKVSLCSWPLLVL